MIWSRPCLISKMNNYLQVIVLAVTGAILALILAKQTRELSILLTIACSVAIIGISFGFLEPIVDFVTELRLLGELEQGQVAILLRSAGMCLVTELACGICEDVGQSTLAKMVRFCGNVALVYIALPLLTAVMDVLKELLGG